VALDRVDAPVPNTVRLLPGEVPKARKVELLVTADEMARGVGSSITQVAARYADSRRRILVANSDGVLAGDDQVKTVFSVSCVASGDAGMQTGRESVGRTIGFELFDDYDVAELARTAARRAITKLSARPAPSGEMTVVIGPGGGGVMFHEACGHGLEADLVNKGASVFAGRLGEQVASPLVTLVDDGTITTSLKASLLAEKGVPSGDVNVEVYKGVVLLSGFVKTQAEKDAAGKVAKNVKDVVSVRNEIAVHPATSMGTKLDDTVLVGKVKAALVDAKDVKSGQINVEARGGIVQLGGFVTSDNMKGRAIAIAKAVPGVKRVDDALFVKPE
jgi:osmotically-inducible protein OsmY